MLLFYSLLIVGSINLGYVYGINVGIGIFMVVDSIYFMLRMVRDSK